MKQHTPSSRPHTARPSSVDIIKSRDLNCDVLIIGAGLAGISVALSLPKPLKIMVLAKEALSTCSSHYAQGGIAACIDKNDSVGAHINDTLIAGDGLCNKSATTEILTQGSDAIAWLSAMGVPFTTDDSNNIDGSNNVNGSNNIDNIEHSNTDCAHQTQATTLHLTQEGGHSQRRVVHADDATGRHIMHALHQKVLAASHITLLPHHEAVSLLCEPYSSEVKSGNLEPQNIRNEPHSTKRCTGAQVYDHSTHTIFAIHSHATVLASGGLGQLFKRATAPSIAMGDGIMMAWEAGCRLANLEFIQFHPTGLAKDDSNFLISEAVRGEGGLLRCPITGKRFMPDYDARAELAPRDIVARAIAHEIAQNGLGYVHLDITHQPPSFIQHHFPDIYAHCLQVGIDMRTQPIPVAPTAHYTCGGVMTTAQGQTDLTSLYAVGEVAHTGLHGANRLASNSLLECVVVGRNIAQHLTGYLCGKEQWHYHASPTPTNFLPVNLSVMFNQQFNHKAVTPSNPSNPSNPSKNIALAKNKAATMPYPIDALKNLMTTHMGIMRSQTQLKAALKQIQNWQLEHKLLSPLPNQNLANVKINSSADLATLRWQRLLTLASLLLQSALTRLESRGGHYRDDYPDAHATALSSVVSALPKTKKSKVA